MQTWIAAETMDADFGDQRLEARYRLLLDLLSDKPSLSLPAACGGYAETQAAYRFSPTPKPHRPEFCNLIATRRWSAFVLRRW